MSGANGPELALTRCLPPASATLNISSLSSSLVGADDLSTKCNRTVRAKVKAVPEGTGVICGGGPRSQERGLWTPGKALRYIRVLVWRRCVLAGAGVAPGGECGVEHVAQIREGAELDDADSTNGLAEDLGDVLV